MKKALIFLVIGILLCSVFSSVFGLKTEDKKLEENKKNDTFNNWEVTSCLDPTFNQILKNPNKKFDVNNYHVLDYFSNKRNMGSCIKETSDDGFIICGNTGKLGCYNGFLLKTDDNGDMIWNETFSIYGETLSYCVEETSDGGFIVAGSTHSTVKNMYLAFLFKTDNQGKEVWKQTYNGLGQAVGMSVKQTDDDGYILAGIGISDDNMDHSKVLLFKTDSNGELISSNYYNLEYSILSIDLEITNDDGYILCGTITDIYVKSLAFLLKTNNFLDEIWNKTYSISNYTFGSSLIQTNDNGYIFCGASNQDGLILKTDDKGVQKWYKIYEDKFCNSIEKTLYNDYIIGGITNNGDSVHAFLLKTNNQGIKIWDYTYDGLGGSELSNVIQTNNNEFVFTGETSKSFMDDDTFILLLKTDDNGLQKWYKTFSLKGIQPGYVKFYGWDESDSNYQVSISIGNHRYSYGSSHTIEYYETDYIQLCPGSYSYTVSYCGREERLRCISLGFIDIYEDEYIDINVNLSFCDDFPEINIVKPEKAIYINNHKIIPFFTSIVIGDIDIQAMAYDLLSGIDHIDFFINDVFQKEVSNEPYIFEWDENNFGRYKITAVAVDKVGYEKEYTMNIWKL